MSSFTIREDQSKLNELGLTVYNRHFSFSRQITISLMSPFFCTTAQSIILPGRSFTMPRNQARNKEPRSKNQQKPISETCPKNSTISSTHESPTTPIAKNKKNFTPFRATSQVSVPAPIADWQSKKKKQKLRIKTLKFVDGDSTFPPTVVVAEKEEKQDTHVWLLLLMILLFQENPFLLKGELILTQLRPWRDGIGYVSTGLKEDKITQCVRRTKPFSFISFAHRNGENEEYEADDEMGKLGCGHLYHIDCITQWLMHKNTFVHPETDGSFVSVQYETKQSSGSLLITNLQ
ncbi:hypothetical protein H5410_062135 [Solanum commersonii]|uniref:RING-type E3 ubiquitin transferase n=1 Tax=Solanum commersonii TaxID=4109 RepID=A0A9J5W9V6_SOLCO|nr:hypothetical protein H5410_062135 [Solanum commersonii]